MAEGKKIGVPVKVALSQKVLEDFYFSKKIFQISILSRKFE
jgi:hypothetical protein